MTSTESFPLHDFKLCTYNGIAGRHLSMLSKLSSNELKMYNMNLGYLYDLIDLVRKFILVQDRNLDENPSTADISQDGADNLVGMDSDLFSKSPEMSMGLLPGTPETSTSVQTQEQSEEEEEITLRLSNNDDSEDGGVDDEGDGASKVASDDEVFIGFANRAQGTKMPDYERYVLRKQILNYHHLVSKKIPAKRPLVISPGLPKSQKRKSSRSANKENEGKSSREATPRKKLHKSKKGRRSAERKSDPCAELKEEHKAFLSDETLSSTDKHEIRSFLENKLNPTYSILEMLSAQAKKDETVSSVKIKLETDGVVFEKDLTKLISTLMEFLYAQTDNPNMVTAQIREGLAVSLVATFPGLAHEPLATEEKPWSWIYDRKNNKGKMANYHANKQKKSGAPRLRGGGSKGKEPKQKKSVEEVVCFNNIEDLQLSKDARYLRFLVPDDRLKAEIEELMEKTFEDRRQLVADDRCPVHLLLQAYPQLKSYEGRMIDSEFERLFKGKGSMLIRDYSDIVPKLLAIAQDNEAKYPAEICFQFADSALNSLIILSMYLPKPKRVQSNMWERNMETLPMLKDFFQTNADLTTFILERREKDRAPIQPYLVAKGTPKNIESIFLILGDSEYIQLPKATMPLKAVDLLVKANYVLGTQFYLGWKYVFRFLIANMYKIPLENPRHSAFTVHYKQIMA